MTAQSPSALKLQAAKLEALAEAADLRAQAADMIAEADAIEAAVHAPVASPAPAAAPVAAPVAAAPASPVSAVPDESMKVLTPHPDGSYTWEPYQPNGAA